MGNRFGFWAKCSVVGLMILARMLDSGNASAQSSSPSSLPLLGTEGIQYVGGFRLPANSSNGEWFSFGGTAMAFNPSGNSLFVSSYHGLVAEVNIPSPVNTSDVNAMPFASYMQGFTDPTEGRLSDVGRDGVNLAGLMVAGGRLYGTASIFYDANNVQRVSHFSRSLQLSSPSFSGWSSVWQADRSGFVAGWMAQVPSEWQSTLGGAALTGQCCVPIAYRTSNGPAAISFNPAQVGQPSVSASPLLYYTLDHPTLGLWDASNPTYGATTQIHGMAVVAGTRTALFIGRNGMGPNCYGNGTANQSLHGSYGPDGAMWCYDPTTSDKGSHAYPYRYQAWAYDLNDFAAVKAGAKQPWEVVPYAVFPLSFPTPESGVKVGGVAYDPQRQLLYVAQLGADPETYASRPVIHAFRMNAVPGSVAAPNTVNTVTVTASKTAPQQVNTAVTFTAQPSGGVAPYQYKWLVSNGTTSTVVANWTTSNTYTWTPTTENANYRVIVWVRSAGNTADVLEATTSMNFPVTAAPNRVASVNLVANRVSPQPAMTAITWTATPTGGVAPYEYKWLVVNGNTTVLANWSTSNTFVWTPSTASAYKVVVWVRSAGNTADAAEGSGEAAYTITPLTSPITNISISANKMEPQLTGTTVTWTATPSGGTAPFLYKWFVSDGTTYTVAANWGSSATFNWTPISANANYRVRVWVKAASNTADAPEASIDKGFSITAPASTPAPPAATAPTTPTTGPAPVTSVTMTMDRTSPQPAGSAVNFTASAAGGVGPREYLFYTFDNNQWVPVGVWSTVPTLRWMRGTPGTYQVQVRSRSAGSTNAQGEASATMVFVLQ